MRTSLEVYGIDPTVWDSMSPRQMYQQKIKIKKIELDRLQDVHYSIRDDSAVNQCLKDLKFNQERLKELG